MMSLLVFRDRIKAFLQKYQMIVKPIVHFIIAFALFTTINYLFGYSMVLKKGIVVLVLSFIGAWLPIGAMFFLSGALTLVHLLTLSPEVAIVYLFLFLIAYTLYIHFNMKSSLPMIFGIVLLALRLPYLLPLLVGMFIGPIGIIPTAFGVLIYYFAGYVKSAVAIINVAATEDQVKAYGYIVDQMIHDKTMWLVLAVFTFVILITYFIYQLPKDNAWIIAIITGGLANAVFYLAGGYMQEIDISILQVVLETVISVLLALAVQFFRCVVDYSRVENVQFEDDEYYYYVKAVPKIVVTAKDVKVKRINTRKKIKDNETTVEEVK